MRALCDLGASTKVKGEGAIGRKGLGFKSVFCVSATPHVLSNGFSFALGGDESHQQQQETGPIGLYSAIVPRWEQPEALAARLPRPPQGGTAVTLVSDAGGPRPISASLDHRKARLAPTPPGARPQQRGGSRWAQSLYV